MACKVILSMSDHLILKGYGRYFSGKINGSCVLMNGILSVIKDETEHVMTSYVFMPENQFSLCTHILVLCRPPPPVGWGSTYYFTAVGFGVRVGVTPITKGPPVQILFWVACFLFPRSLSFDFCYDLDIWAQGQALRAFFVVMSFSLFYPMYEGILIKYDRKLHRHLEHGSIIVDL